VPALEAVMMEFLITELEALCHSLLAHLARVQELLLITQYFDTLEKLANGNATTVFMPHSVGNLASIADDIRNGTMQAGAQQSMRK